MKPSMLVPVTLGLLISACAHTTFVAGLVEEPEEGASPTLVSTAGESVTLSGALAAELARVPGALVRVRGVYKGLGARRRLQVSDYRLLDVGSGVPPHVGRLYWDGTRLLLLEDHTGAALELRGRAVTTLRRETGGRAWVIGPVIAAEVLEVLEYGVLREPSP